jgi:hypothetical protein
LLKVLAVQAGRVGVESALLTVGRPRILKDCTEGASRIFHGAVRHDRARRRIVVPGEPLSMAIFASHIDLKASVLVIVPRAGREENTCDDEPSPPHTTEHRHEARSA